MKIDKFELIQIINENINEILDFNNVDIYDYNYYGKNPLIGEFILDDNSKVKVLQQKINPLSLNIPKVFNSDNGIINLIFTIDDITTQYKKTDLKELLKIIKTVTIIIKKFIDSIQNNPIYILHAESKIKNEFELNDRQKRELYIMILLKHLPKDYRISEGTFENEIPIIVFQRNLKRINNFKQI
jgi:hypothetical protein